MFDPSKADFSGMIEGEDLCVSAAIQKTFMDVNEEGTEAAAATGKPFPNLSLNCFCFECTPDTLRTLQWYLGS